MPIKSDISGKKFGRLTVVSEHGVDKSGKITWDCICECGTKKVCVGGNLRSGKIVSCGCYLKEITRKRSTKHGHAPRKNFSGEYITYNNMKCRCNDPTHQNYKDYGGRGISVCLAWINSFEQFIKDMGLKPYPSYTIERVDNDGNYEPGNCIWATRKQQAQNRRPRPNERRRSEHGKEE